MPSIRDAERRGFRELDRVSVPRRFEGPDAAEAHPLGCKSTTVFSEYPDPIIICVQNHPIVQIESVAFCGGDVADGSTLLLRCGTNASPFSYAGAFGLHNFSTSSDWETVLYGACADLGYTVFFL